MPPPWFPQVEVSTHKVVLCWAGRRFRYAIPTHDLPILTIIGCGMRGIQLDDVIRIKGDALGRAHVA